MTPPPVLASDPRDVIPEFRRYLSDEQVAAWQANPSCLCGCGSPVSVERERRQRTPIHTYRLFTTGHEFRMPWRREWMSSIRSSTDRRALASKIQIDRCIDNCGVLADMVREWQARTGRSREDLAAISGVGARTIGRLCAPKSVRVHKLTAARLLVAMGETQLRPEIARAYRVWATSQGISSARIKNER